MKKNFVEIAAIQCNNVEESNVILAELSKIGYDTKGVKPKENVENFICITKGKVSLKDTKPENYTLYVFEAEKEIFLSVANQTDDEVYHAGELLYNSTRKITSRLRDDRNGISTKDYSMRYSRRATQEEIIAYMNSTKRNTAPKSNTPTNVKQKVYYKKIESDSDTIVSDASIVPKIAELPSSVIDTLKNVIPSVFKILREHKIYIVEEL